MTVAFDTNVLVYACDADDPARNEIATSLLTGSTEGILLWQVAYSKVNPQPWAADAIARVVVD